MNKLGLILLSLLPSLAWSSFKEQCEIKGIVQQDISTMVVSVGDKRGRMREQSYLVVNLQITAAKPIGRADNNCRDFSGIQRFNIAHPPLVALTKGQHIMLKVGIEDFSGLQGPQQQVEFVKECSSESEC